MWIDLPDFRDLTEISDKSILGLTIRGLINLHCKLKWKMSVENTQVLAGALKVTGPIDSAIAETENGALAYPTTGKACLDLFGKVTQEIDEIPLIELVEAAWNEDPLTTLKIIAYIRSCRRGQPGQGLRKPSYLIYKWLITHHPETFKKNFSILLDLGYYGDLKHLYGTEAWFFVANIWTDKIIKVQKEVNSWLKSHEVTFSMYRKSPFNDSVPIDLEACQAASKMMTPLVKGKRRKVINVKKIGQWKDLTDKPNISDFGAVKFIPTHKSGKHQNNLIRKELCKIIGLKTNTSINEQLFRTNYISPINHFFAFPESLICRKNHSIINYSTVPSKANLRHKKSFRNHDGERYSEFLNKVVKGEVKINSSRLYPHEVVHKTRCGTIEDLEADALWTGIHNHLDEEKVFLDDWIAVCDVSGSMSQGVTPTASAIDVSSALTLLIAERNRGKLGQFFLTFSRQCQMLSLDKSKTLREKCNRLHDCEGLNTDFVSVAEELCKQYKLLNITPEDSIKKLVVITDMEFDICQGDGNTLPFEGFSQVFKNSGYPVPKVIFWNVASRNISFPIYSGQVDVALISGFSSDLLYLLLKDDISPIKLMLDAISHSSYQSLTIVD